MTEGTTATMTAAERSTHIRRLNRNFGSSGRASAWLSRHNLADVVGRDTTRPRRWASSLPKLCRRLSAVASFITGRAVSVRIGLAVEVKRGG